MIIAMTHSLTARIALASSITLLLLLAAGARSARADEEPRPEHLLGIGYKIGNGIGFVGADLLVHPISHVTIDLQANYASVDAGDGSGRTVTGYGLAPALHLELRATGSTPYLAVGLLYVRLSLDNAVASGTGAFANLGWNWKWQSGPGIMLGAGVGHLANIEATNGTTTVDRPGQTFFNIEAGFHFMFL
jgi:hypothetical protein